MAVFVGLDIGAKSVQMAWRVADKTVGTAQLAQTADGHQQALKRIKALGAELVVLEATGVYYLDLAVTLSRAGIAVAVINPKSFHHFAKLKLERSKTDAVDAALLAEYGQRMSPPLWTAPVNARLQLRDIGRQINRITKMRTQSKNRLHALSSKSGTLDLLLQDEEEAIAWFDQRLGKLAEAAQGLIEQDGQLAMQLQQLMSAKGVGQVSALAILAELCVLPDELKASQVSRYAGVDVRLCQSGSSVNRPARLSKAGNAYLRSALYMPALSAVRHDPNAKAFYLALQRRGKKKMQALCAVMRKYLTGLWACLHSNEPFDSGKLFSGIHHKID